MRGEPKMGKPMGRGRISLEKTLDECSSYKIEGAFNVFTKQEEILDYGYLRIQLC